MNAHRFLVVLALSVFLGLGLAHAEPIVYDLAEGPGNSKLLVVGPVVLDIVITPGTVPNTVGTVCVDGNGDDLCAADVEIEITGDQGSITGFSPASGIIFEPDPVLPGTKKLRLNLLQSVTPEPISPPQSLGMLTVEILSGASSENPVKVFVSGRAVNAGGTIREIASVHIAATEAPEPSGIVLLLSGALGVLALNRLRNRGASVSVDGARDSR
jgi:hypothetical protein